MGDMMGLIGSGRRDVRMRQILLQYYFDLFFQYTAILVQYTAYFSYTALLCYMFFFSVLAGALGYI